MATYYVDDGGDNTTGASWATAFTSITHATVLAAGAGSTIYVGSSHQETSGSTITIALTGNTQADPINFICADITSGSPPSTYESMEDGGGYIQTTGGSADIILTGTSVWFGIKFDSTDVLQLGNLGQQLLFFDSYFKYVDVINTLGTGGGEGYLRFSGCKFDTTTSYVQLDHDASYVFQNCTWVNVWSSGYFYGDPYDGWDLTVEDCDLSGDNNIMSSGMSSENCQAYFRRCKIHASWTPPTDIDRPTTWLLMESCYAGTSTDPILGLHTFANWIGTVTIESDTEWRTGGATDGTTPYCWKMISSDTDCHEVYQPLRTPPMSFWTRAGSQTIRVYIAGETQLQDDEFWLEVSSPNESSPATARGRFQTSLPGASDDPITVAAAAANLPSEATDKWQATPTYYQYAEVTIDPEEEGVVSVRGCLAKNGTAVTLYVDPKPEVS